MTKEYALIVDSRDCVGCCACEVACKQEHSIPVGPRWIKVTPDGPRIIDNKLQLRYAVAHCLHCIKPACLEVCPVDAISKREDGIVLVDKELCIGCGDCVDACPLGVMQFHDDENITLKCNLCAERIDRGLNPACVNACPAYCIYFGDMEEVIGKIGKNE